MINFLVYSGTFIVSAAGMLVSLAIPLYLTEIKQVGPLLIGLGRNPILATLAMVLIGLSSAYSYNHSLLLHLLGGFPMEVHETITGGGEFLGPLVAGGLGQIFNLNIAFILMGITIMVIGLFLPTPHLFEQKNR